MHNHGGHTFLQYNNKHDINGFLNHKEDYYNMCVFGYLLICKD